VMRATSQAGTIADHIMACVNKGMTDKSEIITHTVDTLGVPRPTVRRVKRDLVAMLKEHVKVLS